MDRLEVTSTEVAVLLGTSKQVLIQNVCSEIIYWSVAPNSVGKFRLSPSELIMVDYDVYLSSDSFDKEFIVVGRL